MKMAWWRKTNLANVVSAFILVTAMLFFIWVKNVEGIMILVGFAGGYLYGRRAEERR